MKYNINDYITTELCPHCNEEIRILRKGVSACTNCEDPVLPCSECEECDKNNCPYGKLCIGAIPSDVNVCSAEIFEDVLKQLNKDGRAMLFIHNDVLYTDKQVVNNNIDGLRCRSLDISVYEYNLCDKITEVRCDLSLSCSEEERRYRKGFIHQLVAETFVLDDIGELAFYIQEFLNRSNLIPLVGPRYDVADAPESFNYDYIIFDRKKEAFYTDELGDYSLSDSKRWAQRMANKLNKKEGNK